MKADPDKLSKEESELYNQARMVVETVETKGWKEIILPYMLTLPSFPNPKNYTDINNMILPYTQAYGEAEAIRKLNQYIQNNIDMFESLTKKAEGKDVVSNFQI